MKRLDDIIEKIEKFLLSLLLSLMILVAFFQILLRNLLSTGISWGDLSVRYLVLWVGFIGASLAVRQGKHITIDPFSHWLKGVRSLAVGCMTNLFSAFVCALLTVAAVTFVRIEVQLGDISPLGVSTWVLQIVLPITCAVMSVRFACRSFRAFSDIITHRRESGSRKDL